VKELCVRISHLFSHADGLELSIMIIATFFQAIVAGNSHAVNIVASLIFCRFLMGIGIGGDYPLSAVIMS
jgi:PHS family inorganic phosphate transporter-like MFS transporter